MFTITITRGQHVSSNVYLFYTLAECKRAVRGTFAESDVDAVTVYAPNGKVVLQLMK